MNNGLIEITKNSDLGYKPLVYFEGWRVAILNDDPEKFRKEKITFLERHNTTDEVFVLLDGECTLLIGGAGAEPSNITYVSMERNQLYNIKKTVWHNLIGSCGFSVLIVENADTSKQNSDFFPVIIA